MEVHFFIFIIDFVKDASKKYFSLLHLILCYSIITRRRYFNIGIVASFDRNFIETMCNRPFHSLMKLFISGLLISTSWLTFKQRIARDLISRLWKCHVACSFIYATVMESCFEIVYNEYSSLAGHLCSQTRYYCFSRTVAESKLHSII